MKILNYSRDHERFRKRLKAFCQKEILPNIDQWEKDHLVPKSVWRKIGGQGFLCTGVSAEYGGLGGDFLYSIIVLEEMARTNHYGLDTFLHSDIVVPYIDAYGSEAQKRKYLPGCVSGDIITAVAMTEPDAGSDLASIETTAVEDNNEIVINGSKTFISNGINCDLVVLAAKDPEVENPYKAISLYLVEADTKGFSKGAPLDKLGVRSQDTTELFFNNCRIPVSNRLGEKGTGFVKLMEKLQQERLLVAKLGATLGEFALDWTIDEILRSPDAKIPQAVQFEVVEMYSDLKMARTFLDRLIDGHMKQENLVTETSIAKYWCTETANTVVRKCLDIAGMYGILEDCPIARTFRDLRVTTIFAGTNEIMKKIIAKRIGIER